MLWHCGLLSERPEKDATLAWVRRGGWDLPGHPPEIERDRLVWLNMPGFPVSYHEQTLNMDRRYLKRFIGADYERVKDDVAKNWLSCTREDAVKLSHLRSGTGHMPVICQLKIIDDLKRGMSPSRLAAEYRVHPQTISNLGKGRISTRAWVPKGFELIRY